MKHAFTVIAIGASLVAAQDLASLAPCGQTCIGNMLAMAPSLGCGADDAACLCSSAMFGYGVRDCSNEACGDDVAAAQSAIAYGAQYCMNALASAGSSSAAGASILTSAGESSATGTAASGASSLTSADGSSAGSSGAAASGGASAITTSALTALVSGTDSSFITTTGFTTIYDSMSAPAEATGTNSAGELTDSAGNVVASATSTASDAISSVESSASDALSSATDALASASTSASDLVESATSSSSEGGAPLMTAAPMLAAGVLAMLAL